jgi:outer membrane protein assembly factor BamE
MKNIISLIIMSFFLVSCSFFRPHKMDIEQGNILPPAATSQLHVGMTVAEVKHLLGNPVFVDIFADDRMNYVYTFMPAYGRLHEERITLFIQHGRVRAIERF